jgi:hypothetical protein
LRDKGFSLLGPQKISGLWWILLKKSASWAEYGIKIKGQIYPTTSSINSYFSLLPITSKDFFSKPYLSYQENVFFNRLFMIKNLLSN